MEKIKDPTKNNGNSTILIGSIVLIIVVVLGGLYFFLNKQAEEREVWDMTISAPDNLTVEYVEDDILGHYVSFRTVEEPDHVIDIFEDPSCPFCSDFAQAHGETLNDKLASGELELNAHMMNFLDENSGMTYSDDASSIIIELAKNGDAVNAWRVYNEIWENQPGTGTALDQVPTMDDMISALKSSDVTVDESVIQELEDDSQKGQRAQKSNVTNTDSLIETTNRVSTPTVFFDNDQQQFEIGDNEYLEGLFEN